MAQQPSTQNRILIVLRSPVLQGLGVAVALPLNLIALYYAQQQAIWLYSTLVIIVIYALFIGFDRASHQQVKLYLVAMFFVLLAAIISGIVGGSQLVMIRTQPTVEALHTAIAIPQLTIDALHATASVQQTTIEALRATVSVQQTTIDVAQTAIAAKSTSSASNRLVTYDDFEDTDNGWPNMHSVQFSDDGTRISEFPKDSSFPGTMSKNLTKDYSLTGNSSLRVTTSVNTPGKYQDYLFRQGTFTGNGVTIYVFTPELTDVTINYIQLCVPSYDWACSFGTRIVPGEWTPITLDLSQKDNLNGEVLYRKKLDLAIQWNFTANTGTSHTLYFDSVEIFHSDSR